MSRCGRRRFDAADVVYAILKGLRPAQPDEHGHQEKFAKQTHVKKYCTDRLRLAANLQQLMIGIIPSKQVALPVVEQLIGTPPRFLKEPRHSVCCKLRKKATECQT